MTSTKQFPKSLEEYMPFLEDISREVSFPIGSKVRTDNVYILLEGSCSLCVLNPNGEEQTLLFFEPGMLLNFIPCISKKQKLHTLTKRRMVNRKDFMVRARTNCRCLAIDPDGFMEKLQTTSAIKDLLVRGLTENLLNMLSMASNAPVLPAAQRICHFLSQMMQSEAPHALPIKLTYAEIANHLSIHSITVAKIFKKLKERGIISKSGRTVVVSNVSLLQRIAQGVETLAYREKEED